MNARALRLQALIAIAVACAVLTSFSDDATSDSTAQAVVAPARADSALSKSRMSTVALLDAPKEAARRVASAEFSAALFAARSWRKPAAPAAPVVAPPQAPAPPPFPYEVLGRLNKAGAQEVFFLSHADRLYDVKIGDVIEGAYSVDAYTDGELLVTYLPLKMQQTVRVEESKP